MYTVTVPIGGKLATRIFGLPACIFSILLICGTLLEADPYLEVDGVASLNIRHPGGEERRGHPRVAVLAARDRRLPVTTLTAHPHLHVYSSIEWKKAYLYSFLKVHKKY